MVWFMADWLVNRIGVKVLPWKFKKKVFCVAVFVKICLHVCRFVSFAAKQRKTSNAVRRSP